MKFNRKIFFAAGITGMVFLNISCDRDPVVPPMPEMERISVAGLRSLFSGTETLVDTAAYIQGIVTLTPELNNIPDFIGYLQDETGGITLTVTGNNTLASGSELKIMCQGLTLNEYRGLLQFGDVDLSTDAELIRIDAGLPAPRAASLAEVLNGDIVAEYIEIADVQFEEAGTYSGGKTLTDCISGAEVYTRSEATFAGNALPAGNGIFRGVVSFYDDPQLIIVDPSHLVMEGERCGGTAGEYLNENFESLGDYDEVTEIAGWTNPLQSGDRKWIARVYSSNVYVQASAYSSGLNEMISWMVSPAVNLSASASPVLTFDTKAGYDNGATLEVMISSDYGGSGSPWDFTWTDLNPVLDDGPPGGYSTNFVSSGDLDLSGYKSTVYIAFVYKGEDPAGTANDKTTTWQVDNVLIKESGR